jgi:hypothetical protein
MSDEISRGEIVRFSRTVFLADRTLIVFRHAGFLGNLPSHDKLVFFVDDDVVGGKHDPMLPFDYRSKLALFEARSYARLSTRADIIAASCPRLVDIIQRQFPGKRVALVEPAWPTPAQHLEHSHADFARVAYLGARSHKQDFEFLVPIIEAVLLSGRRVVFTVSGEHSVPRSLQNHPGLEILPPMSWNQYQSWMRNRSFDIGLYPLLCSKFNESRSANKLLEYDQFGAAVIASSRWTAATTLGSEGHCKFLDDHPESWIKRILHFIDNPEAAQAVAQKNRQRTISMIPEERQRRTWRVILGAIS